MKYFIFKDQIFTIFLSMTHLSAVTFPDKVHDYVGGEVGDFKIYELNKGKSLVYEAKRKGIDKNFIVFERSGKYHFNIKYDEVLANKDIVIKLAEPCKLLSLIKETPRYKLFECPKSLFIVNKTKEKLRVNETLVSDKKYISKGPPVWINNKLIYYKGETI